MRLHKALDVADLQAMARRQVPRMFYDYTDTGSWTESTYHANEAELQKLHFRHRVGRDLSNCSTQAHMLDKDCAMPVALSPWGSLACTALTARYSLRALPRNSPSPTPCPP